VDVRPITLALERAARGEPGADQALWDLVYSDLKQLAASRLRALQPGQTLQATALVHEAWMRLNEVGTRAWESRAHFFGAAARSMRNILVDHARHQRRLKRGGQQRPQALSTDLAAKDEDLAVDLLALDEALDALGEQYERPARIIMLRFFAGLPLEEIAEMLGITTRTVDRDLLFARTWLRRFLDRA
jgi:RNA polymerase sigma factor (TIGR02999 family)